MANSPEISSAGVKRTSVFENYPKSALSLIMLVVFIVSILLAELMLGYQDGSKKISHYDNYGIERYIVLREGRPFSAGYQMQAHSKKKYLVSVDSNGFLEPSEVHKTPDKKVFFLGGSTTECFFNNVEKRFPYLSGRLLEKMTGVQINAYNAGRSNNNSAHSIDVLYNKVLALNPDIVVLMHNVNDIGTIDVQGTYWNNTGMFPLIENKNIQSDESLRLTLKGLKDLLIPRLYARVKSFFRKKDQHPHVVTEFEENTVDYRHYIREFESNLNIFMSICKYRNITPVLMTQANRLIESPDQDVIEYYKLVQRVDGLRLTYKQFSKLHQLFNEAIRKIGRENNILVIDLDKSIPRIRENMFDAYHLTDKGSVLVSEVIAGHLKNLVDKK